MTNNQQHLSIFGLCEVELLSGSLQDYREWNRENERSTGHKAEKTMR
jgi:hypothetical protein